MATQLGHAHLEGDPGPGGALPEDHGQAATLQGGSTHLSGFESLGEGEKPQEVLPRVVGYGYEMAC